jgi:methylated-DNA-protein-cysteine methyltransferase-like protein
MAGKPTKSQPESAAEAALKRIRAAVAAIPRGRVASYGQIAANAGLKGRARLVGFALRRDDGKALPWHRILRADGRIAFAPGSRGFLEQCRRLKREGVTVTRGRVDLSRFTWERDLDAALWKP